MFGINMYVKFDGFGVALRPLARSDIAVLTAHFSSMKVHMYTQGMYAQPLENEEEWYDKNRNDPGSCVWGIVPDGASEVVGITALHNVDSFGSATSGIIIWNTDWWGRGVATRAHLGRTLFAADYLNRSTIRSSARTKNNGSVHALLTVGYNYLGIEPRTYYRGGEYLDTQLFCWMNPYKIKILYPKGLPAEYKDGVKKAKIALDKARKVVSLP
jgi:RimJ/RimL family protein N-acetyltransferase